MLRTGILHKAQALASGIDLAQGGPYRLAILRRNQRVDRAEHTSESRLDLRQQISGGLTGAVKIKGMINPGQRGGQKGGMPTEAETHHVDGSVRVTGS